VGNTAAADRLIAEINHLTASIHWYSSNEIRLRAELAVSRQLNERYAHAELAARQGTNEKRHDQLKIMNAAIGQLRPSAFLLCLSILLYDLPFRCGACGVRASLHF
jgi:hypothetical protein